MKTEPPRKEIFAEGGVPSVVGYLYSGNNLKLYSPGIRALITIVSACALSLVMATIAHAQSSGGAFVPLSDANFQEIFDVNTSGGGGDIASFINGAFKAALSVGAILAVLRIAYAGYLYMGTDMWHTKSHAKEILGDVVLGLLLLLGIYLILWQINPDLLRLDILRNVRGEQSTSRSAATPASFTSSRVPAGTLNSGGTPVDQNGNPI
jgi:hypothetical protein